jgi:hypothetical protein
MMRTNYRLRPDVPRKVYKVLPRRVLRLQQRKTELESKAVSLNVISLYSSGGQRH